MHGPKFFAHRDLYEAIASLETRAEEKVVLDFSLVAHLNAASVGCALSGGLKAMREGRRLAIVHGNAPVWAQLDLDKLRQESIAPGSKVPHVCRSLHDALEFLAH